MDAFLQTMDKPRCRVDQILSQGERNRRFLESIIRCLELCGRHGIALRGHRDDGILLEDTEESTNMGNFKALIKLVSLTDELGFEETLAKLSEDSHLYLKNNAK